jgi:hypothetical protein
LEIVRLLLEHGADCTAQGHEAIREANFWGYVEVVKLLKKHGAKPSWLTKIKEILH